MSSGVTFLLFASCRKFIFLPMEYLAFLGDEMIMYCCSAGRVTPRLVPGCFGEATAVKWEWLEYQNTEL